MDMANDAVMPTSVSIIPNLKLKMGIDCITDAQLKRITEVSRFVSELANLPHNRYLPYVGDSAFAHKGGLHVSAIRKNDTLTNMFIQNGLEIIKGSLSLTSQANRISFTKPPSLKSI